MPSGDGMRLTNSPKPAASSDQTSIAMAVEPRRNSPGLGGVVLGKA